jgi:hypothetical protein
LDAKEDIEAKLSPDQQSPASPFRPRTACHFAVLGQVTADTKNCGNNSRFLGSLFTPSSSGIYSRQICKLNSTTPSKQVSIFNTACQFRAGPKSTINVRSTLSIRPLSVIGALADSRREDQDAAACQHQLVNTAQVDATRTEGLAKRSSTP